MCLWYICDSSLDFTFSWMFRILLIATSSHQNDKHNCLFPHAPPNRKYFNLCSRHRHTRTHIHLRTGKYNTTSIQNIWVKLIRAEILLKCVDFKLSIFPLRCKINNITWIYLIRFQFERLWRFSILLIWMWACGWAIERTHMHEAKTNEEHSTRYVFDTVQIKPLFNKI